MIQAQIEVGIMSLLYTSTLFGKVEEKLGRIWQFEVLNKDVGGLGLIGLRISP